MIQCQGMVKNSRDYLAIFQNNNAAASGLILFLKLRVGYWGSGLLPVRSCAKRLQVLYFSQSYVRK